MKTFIEAEALVPKSHALHGRNYSSQTYNKPLTNHDYFDNRLCFKIYFQDFREGWRTQLNVSHYHLEMKLLKSASSRENLSSGFPTR